MRRKPIPAPPNFKPLKVAPIGQRFGRLVVTGWSDLVGIRNCRGYKVYLARWSCICDCGKPTTVSPCNARKLTTTSCGCAKYDFSYQEASFREWLRSYRNNARTRKISFELNREEFTEITSANCFYCDASPQPRFCLRRQLDSGDVTYVGNGIDRVNNSIGYIRSNSVACCTTCNLMKLEMSSDEFVNHVEIIARCARSLHAGFKANG